jgi:hypothetical protein
MKLIGCGRLNQFLSLKVDLSGDWLAASCDREINTLIRDQLFYPITDTLAQAIQTIRALGPFFFHRITVQETQILTKFDWSVV